MKTNKLCRTLNKQLCASAAELGKAFDSPKKMAELENTDVIVIIGSQTFRMPFVCQVVDNLTTAIAKISRDLEE